MPVVKIFPPANVATPSLFALHKTLFMALYIRSLFLTRQSEPLYPPSISIGATVQPEKPLLRVGFFLSLQICQMVTAFHIHFLLWSLNLCKRMCKMGIFCHHSTTHHHRRAKGVETRCIYLFIIYTFFRLALLQVHIYRVKTC